MFMYSVVGELDPKKRRNQTRESARGFFFLQFYKQCACQAMLRSFSFLHFQFIVVQRSIGQSFRVLREGAFSPSVCLGLEPESRGRYIYTILTGEKGPIARNPGKRKDKSDKDRMTR